MVNPEERESCWIFNCPQRSKEWFSLRSKRITASDFGTVLNHNSFSSQQTLLDRYAGKKVTKCNPAMLHGIRYEPIARDWYSSITGNEVKDIGFAVSKKYPFLGGSPDGEVGEDGMIEIKCPQKIYQPLITFLERTADGWTPDEYYHQHIWDSHYDQIQGCMGILGKKWCDYIVYSTNDKVRIKLRIPFNQDYWENFMVPNLVSFYKEEVEPIFK